MRCEPQDTEEDPDDATSPDSEHVDEDAAFDLWRERDWF